MIQISLERKITLKEVKIKMAVDFPAALLDAQAFEKEIVFILHFYTQPLMKNSFFITVMRGLKTQPPTYSFLGS